jgi:hypothetical protein
MEDCIMKENLNVRQFPSIKCISLFSDDAYQKVCCTMGWKGIISPVGESQSLEKKKKGGGGGTLRCGILRGGSGGGDFGIKGGTRWHFDAATNIARQIRRK